MISRNVRALLVVFVCNHCPYVKHIQKEFVSLARRYLARGVGVVAISSNDVEHYPQDGPDKMAEEAAGRLHVSVSLRRNQEVAKAYQAACTPDLFLFDQNHRLVYRGQFDDSRPGSRVR